MIYKILGKINRASRREAHHGLLHGYICRSITHMQMIYDAASTTDETRELAAKIEGQLMVLQQLIKTRRT